MTVTYFSLCLPLEGVLYDVVLGSQEASNIFFSLTNHKLTAFMASSLLVWQLFCSESVNWLRLDAGQGVGFLDGDVQITASRHL